MPNNTRPRPYLAAHTEATRASFPDVVRGLSEILGRKLTAYIGGAADARAVDRWIEGASPYHDKAEPRLRLAFQIAKFLSEYDDASVVQAWFTGLNPQLEDRSPIRLLRDGDPEEEGREVLTAALAFAVGG